ncbi:collagen binding domain-containing protein [Streptomyces sp. NPDC058874]|uniref:MSCRAMM family protein n=1 Tax=unclassified Streptomyces TaxID=2593676 RepID=UPI0036A36B3B
MKARTTAVRPIGLATAVVFAAAGPALAAPPAAPSPGTARVVLRSTDADTGTPLPGARFELWRETNDRAGLQSTGPAGDERQAAGCATGATGLCTVELATGETYYAVQVAVPTGYQRPDEPFAGFDLREAAAREGLVVNVPNRSRDAVYSGGIQVRKRDGKTGAPLHGAVFEIWKETNGTSGLQTAGLDADLRPRAGCATDADGTCDFEGLADGSYFLVEKDVPEGYVMPGNPVAGPWRLDGASGRRIVLTVYNKRAEQIPTVGADDGRRARTARSGAPPE